MEIDGAATMVPLNVISTALSAAFDAVHDLTVSYVDQETVVMQNQTGATIATA